jgi:hypothetical protein
VRGLALRRRVHRRLHVFSDAQELSAGLALLVRLCATHDLHPYKGVRRTHVELYLRELETQLPQPSNATLYRRVSTLSS